MFDTELAYYLNEDDMQSKSWFSRLDYPYADSQQLYKKQFLY
jgi:hypothetical protein